MEAWLDGIAVPQLTTSAILGIAILMLFRGQLDTKKSVDRLVALYESRIADLTSQRDEWKQAWQIAESGRSLAAEQNGAMLGALKTTERVVDSLPKVEAT